MLIFTFSLKISSQLLPSARKSTWFLWYDGKWGGLHTPLFLGSFTVHLDSCPYDMGMGKTRGRMGDGMIVHSIVSCKRTWETCLAFRFLSGIWEMDLVMGVDRPRHLHSS